MKYLERSLTGEGRNIQDELSRDYYSNAARNIIIYEKLKDVLRAFKEKGIEVILLKGAALAETVYPSIALRPMVDVDLLVQEEDLAKVDEKLRQLGYKLETGGERHYIKAGKWPMNLDIHWDAWYCKSEDLWRNVKEIKINEARALVLAPEESLIYLATHLAIHHGMSGGIWLADIAQLTRYYREAFDWNGFTEKVITYNVDIPVYYTLRAARELSGAEIPAQVLDKLKPSGSKCFEAKLYQFILQSSPINEIGHLLHPLVHGGLTGKAAFLWGFTFPDVEFMRRRYRVSWPYPYYLVRPAQHLYKATRLLSQLLCQAFLKPATRGKPISIL